MADPIQIDGLREFVRNLKKIDNDLPKALRVSLNDAGQVVVDRARARVPSRTGRARRSVRARSTRTAVRIVGGGARVSYYPWLDFGGTIRPHRHPIKRPFMKEGRYIYRAYFDLREKGEFQRRLVEALVVTARAAGVEVD